MNARTFLKTLCLVPIGAVVTKLPEQGVSQVAEPMMEMPRGFIPPKKLCKSLREIMIDNGVLTPEGNPTPKYFAYFESRQKRLDYEQTHFPKDPRIGGTC